ncbi:probable thioredoxin-related transmembrane protein 1 [Coccomyxa sp. Obi]|nr:probable thioredoxin-related transmembrane protein 1 [Coccomyxa sp. Obi]
MIFTHHECNAQPGLIRLESKNFEGLTQASTGQTTGIWFVLFTSSVEPSLQALSESWAQLGEVQQGAPILHGLVDIAEDHYLAERFSITNVPTFLLFRDRKMYRYSGVDTGADALRHFSREGYKSSDPLPVPPVVSPIDVALRALKSNSKLAVAGAALAFAAVALALLWRQGTSTIAKPDEVGKAKDVKAQ